MEKGIIIIKKVLRLAFEQSVEKTAGQSSKCTLHKLQPVRVFFYDMTFTVEGDAESVFSY